MKEQIKELMKQAGTDTSGKWMGVEHAEKLVELIVRECISMCDNVSADYLKHRKGHLIFKIRIFTPKVKPLAMYSNTR